MEVSAVSSFSSTPQAAAADADAISLSRLSGQFERLLNPAFLNRTDAEIVLAARGGAVVGAYSCILAARSPFLHHHISSVPAGEKAQLKLADLVPGGGHIGREALQAVLGYMYTGSFRVPPQECMAETCCHGSCRPAIDFIVESTYAASGFQIPELVSLCQRRLSDIVEIAYDEDLVPIVLVASTCQLFDLLNQCMEKVANSALNNYLAKQLPADVYNIIDYYIPDPCHDKTVKSIHKAMDSDDVELVGMILKEYSVTLDYAFALHYAASCCTPKMLVELLNLNSANVNLMNNDGYTPLHMACMRLEPGIILPLVEKGASVLQRTPDGRDALTICKRLAREKDFNRELEKCRKRSNACLCIDILEKAKGKCFTSDQASVEDTIFTPLLVDNLDVRLSYLEHRVKLAKLFFPFEATFAMRSAGADATEEFTGTSNVKEVGLNKTPTMQNIMLRKRLYVLTETVELGRKLFPNCSNELDKVCDEEATELALLENDNPEDQLTKRTRFSEIREEVQKAFDKDMAAGAHIPSIASSSSSPRLDMLIPGTSSSSQAAGVTDSANAPALPLGLCNQALAGIVSGQPEAQGSDVAADKPGVGWKTKLKSAVWKEFEKIKVEDGWKGKCRWCRTLLSAASKNGTTHLKRHLDTCGTRKAAVQSKVVTE
ncbi:hypothetical protein EJB05_05276, partial [Eragrostis curvula]